MPASLLSGPAVAPASGGAAKQLVVFLHGVGADGADLIGLAEAFAPILPDAEFLAPDAPQAYDMGGGGRQWFSLADHSGEGIARGVRAAAPTLDAYLSHELARRGLTDDALALVGFSQGTMMALHVGLRRVYPCRAIVGFSGLLAAVERLPREVRVRPPTLLVHGEDDPLVPVQCTTLAAKALETVGVAVDVVIRPHLAHGIDEAGVVAAVRFLDQHFGAGESPANAK